MGNSFKKRKLTLDDREIDDSFEYGDLTRMDEIDEWLAAAQRKGKFNQPNGLIALTFQTLIWHSDGASLIALTQLLHFNLITSIFLNTCHGFEFANLQDDPFLLANLRDALLLHVSPEHEERLRWLLRRGTKVHSPRSVLEMIDALWSKAFSNDSNHIENLKDFYREVLEEQEKDKTNISLIKVAIHIGIPRHISLMQDFINDLSYKDELDTFTRSKLLEWMVSSRLDIKHELLGVESTHVALVKEFLNERQFFASQLCPNICQYLPTQSELTNHDLMRRILAQLNNCRKTCTADKKKRAVAWLLSQICMALEEVDPGATCEPILTGSAAECTQALFIDEFDYLLRTTTKFIGTAFKERLETIVTKMGKRIHHPRLAIESMTFNCYGSYPCLYISWVDEEFRNTNISIDLIPVVPLQQPVSLPHHNFLPVPRDHQPEEIRSTQRKAERNQDTEIVDHGERSATATNKVPRLFSDEHYSKIVFSQVENGLIKALPFHIIEGYRLAKAVRIMHVIQPIVQKLIDLGVTLDIHNVIRTYHLKTCVFYLTQHYVFDESDIEGNNRLKWAIAIFEKLREFVVVGDVKEFFATHRYVFRGLVWASQPECDHKEEDVNASLPRFHCCRRRKARLLIVDQILSVLREYYGRQR